MEEFNLSKLTSSLLSIIKMALIQLSEGRGEMAVIKKNTVLENLVYE